MNARSNILFEYVVVRQIFLMGETTLNPPHNKAAYTIKLPYKICIAHTGIGCTI